MLGCANPEGAQGGNIARLGAARAGLPVSVPGQVVNRFCGSGLQAIATAAGMIIAGHAETVVAGGVESISAVQDTMNTVRARDPWVQSHLPQSYLPMIETAEVVARRYGVTREAQDAYGVMSHHRAAAAQERGLFADEIVPVSVRRALPVRGQPVPRLVEAVVDQDEGIRADASVEAAALLAPVLPGGTVTAANASGFADGASATVLMEESKAHRDGHAPLGRLLGFAAAGCDPDEMGIGPVLAVPKLLARAGLRVEDIGLWELNEAFASQVLYCRDALEIPTDRLNVNGGAIAIGHPYGSSGSRMVGHVLREGRRRSVQHAVVTMCIGGGQGVAALLEVLPGSASDDLSATTGE